MEQIEEASDSPPGVVDGAFAGATEEMLELGERLLDRIAVGAAGRQEEELGADAA